MKRTSLFLSLALCAGIFGFTTIAATPVPAPTPNPLMLIYDGVVGCVKYVYTVGDNFIKAEVVPLIAKHPKVTLGLTAATVGYLLIRNYMLKRDLQDLSTFSCDKAAGVSQARAAAIATGWKRK